MAEYNPSKIIKDGNTYNFRDTTKIPLAGSNQISGSLIPSTDGTVNLGGTSYQWNNAYIKSLTINGVACGDILTHNVSEFVDVSSNQTINGDKTFTARLTYKSTSTIAGDGASSNFAGSFNFTDKNNVQIGIFGLNVFNNKGYTEQVLNIINPLWFNDNTKTKSFAVRLRVRHDTGEVSFIPSTSNIINLGSTTQKWKTFNGINPGALSLPSVSSGINLDLTNFKIDGSDNYFRLTNFSNYPYDNGWLFVRLNGCTSYYLEHWYKVVSNSYATPSEAIFFLPINDIDHDIMLRCVCTSINYIRVFPCQGNV